MFQKQSIDEWKELDGYDTSGLHLEVDINFLPQEISMKQKKRDYVGKIPLLKIFTKIRLFLMPKMSARS